MRTAKTEGRHSCRPGEAGGNGAGGGTDKKSGGSIAAGKGETRLLKEYRTQLDATRKASDTLQKILEQATKDASSVKDDSQLVRLDLHRLEKGLQKPLQSLGGSVKSLADINKKVAGSILE